MKAEARGADSDPAEEAASPPAAGALVPGGETLFEAAILAPIPEVHLTQAAEIARREGYVAFGTDKFGLFRDLDARRGEHRVQVLLYPSQVDGRGTNFSVAWVGRYAGHVEGRAGRHPGGDRHRPPSTGSDGRWGLFWHVSDLRPLAERIPISRLRSATGGNARQPAAPRGPELVVPVDLA